MHKTKGLLKYAWVVQARQIVVNYFEPRPALFETNYKETFGGVYYSEITWVNSYLAGFSSPD